MVVRRVKLLIAARRLRLMRLRRHWPNMASSRRRFLLRSRPRAYAAVAAIKTDAIIIVHYRRAINIGVVNDPDVYIVYRAVVIKVVAVPSAADVAAAIVAKAIIDPAIKSDRRPPITGNKNIRAVFPSPIARRPEQARIGSLDPSAGYPVVVVAVPGPIARRPDVIRTGTCGLLINR